MSQIMQEDGQAYGTFIIGCARVEDLEVYDEPSLNLDWTGMYCVLTFIIQGILLL